MQAVIGVDLGTQSVKAVLVDVGGLHLAAASVPTVYEVPRPGWAQQEPEVLVAAVLEALARLAALRPSDVEVVALALAGQMGGAVGLARGGAPVTHHELWLDTRADADRTSILESAGEEIVAANGIIPFVAPRIRRWLRVDPKLRDRIDHVAMAVGCVLAALVEPDGPTVVCDRAQAGLFGCFDVRTGNWSPSLAQACGVPTDVLPELVSPYDRVGALGPTAARAARLQAALPVYAGTGDGIAGWLAAGATRAGVCVDSAGTSDHFAIAVPAFTAPAPDELTCVPSAVPGLHHVLGFTTGTGLTHRWAAQQFGDGNYGALGVSAREVEPGAGGVRCIPHFAGRATPFAPDVRGAFVGVRSETSTAHLYRAVLEATAYEAALWASEAEIDTAAAGAFVAAIGGGAESDTWLQIKADVLGAEVRRLRPWVNPARGAALIAAHAHTGIEVDDPGWHGPELHERAFVPDAAAHERYVELLGEYRVFRGAMDVVFSTPTGTARLGGAV